MRARGAHLRAPCGWLQKKALSKSGALTLTLTPSHQGWKARRRSACVAPRAADTPYVPQTRRSHAAKAPSCVLTCIARGPLPAPPRPSALPCRTQSRTHRNCCTNRRPNCAHPQRRVGQRMLTILVFAVALSRATPDPFAGVASGIKDTPQGAGSDGGGTRSGPLRRPASLAEASESVDPSSLTMKITPCDSSSTSQIYVGPNTCIADSPSSSAMLTCDSVRTRHPASFRPLSAVPSHETRSPGAKDDDVIFSRHSPSVTCAGRVRGQVTRA